MNEHVDPKSVDTEPTPSHSVVTSGISATRFCTSIGSDCADGHEGAVSVMRIPTTPLLSARMS